MSFLYPMGWSGGGQGQSTARSADSKANWEEKAQFVIVNVVDQYEMCVFPIKIQIQMLIFMKLNR